MKTKRLEFHKVNYLVPADFIFVDTFIFRYPSACGADEGIGDKVVPEKIGGMKISHICAVHDYCWEVCEPTLSGFAKSNAMFGHNLAIYLSTGDGGFFAKMRRVVKSTVYVVAVSTVGYMVFKRFREI